MSSAVKAVMQRMLEPAGRRVVGARRMCRCGAVVEPRSARTRQEAWPTSDAMHGLRAVRRCWLVWQSFEPARCRIGNPRSRQMASTNQGNQGSGNQGRNQDGNQGGNQG